MYFDAPAADNLERLRHDADAKAAEGDTVTAMAMYKVLVGQGARVLHEYNLTTMRSRDAFARLLLDADNVDAAIPHLRETLRAYRRNFPIGVMVGLQTALVAKGEVAVGNAQQGLLLTREAISLLSVTHGLNSKLLADLRELERTAALTAQGAASFIS